MYVHVDLGSSTEEEAHSSYDPLGCLLFGLQVEGPHKGGPSGACLVHWALVDILCLLLVNWDGPKENDRHSRRKLLQLGLLDQPSLRVPAGTLHEQPVDIGSLPGRTAEVLLALLGHVTLQAHLVQWPLILAGHGLHDGGEEGLGVEEPSQPDAGGHVEVRHPTVQFTYPLQEVCVPDRQAIEGWVGSFGPGTGHFV